MTSIYNINEELCSIALTSTELLSVSKIITRTIKKEEFVRQYAYVVSEINKSYCVLDDLLSPFYQLDSESKFTDNFHNMFMTFKDTYLLEISKPRKYCDNVYDPYIELMKNKEAKTGYPLLKNQFSRLNKLYDKWINNDVYLAMSIDRVVKLIHNVLKDILMLTENDIEDAFVYFSSSLEDFSAYLTLINQNRMGINNVLLNACEK